MPGEGQSYTIQPLLVHLLLLFIYFIYFCSFQFLFHAIFSLKYFCYLSIHALFLYLHFHFLFSSLTFSPFPFPFLPSVHLFILLFLSPFLPLYLFFLSVSLTDFRFFLLFANMLLYRLTTAPTLHIKCSEVSPFFCICKPVSLKFLLIVFPSLTPGWLFCPQDGLCDCK